MTRDPQERLGTKGGMEVMRHDFFAVIDWHALNRREITPPFNPCRNRTGEEDTDNFESTFTSMPLRSIDDSAIGMRQSVGSPTFENFTYEEDAFLDRKPSRSFEDYPISYKK